MLKLSLLVTIRLFLPPIKKWPKNSPELLKRTKYTRQRKVFIPTDRERQAHALSFGPDKTPPPIQGGYLRHPCPMNHFISVESPESGKT